MFGCREQRINKGLLLDRLGEAFFYGYAYDVALGVWCFNETNGYA